MAKETKAKRLARKAKREEMLSHFPPDSGYAELQLPDGSWYVKMLMKSGMHSFWTVAHYTEESFKRYKWFARKRDGVDTDSSTV